MEKGISDYISSAKMCARVGGILIFGLSVLLFALELGMGNGH